MFEGGLQEPHFHSKEEALCTYSLSVAILTRDSGEGFNINYPYLIASIGLRADPGSYTFIFAPTKRATVLALSATACEQVAVSPETAMGCCRIRFLQEEEGYYCTFILKKY